MKTQADFLAMLERSYDFEFEYHAHPGNPNRKSRLDYLGDNIFDFTTYDSTASEVFATRALAICKAINDGKPSAYHGQSDEHYLWYLALCNMPFFAERITWGSSIRVAFWEYYAKLKFTSFSLYDEKGDQIAVKSPMSFEEGEWENFINALIEFAQPELVL